MIRLMYQVKIFQKHLIILYTKIEITMNSTRWSEVVITWGYGLVDLHFLCFNETKVSIKGIRNQMQFVNIL